MEEVQQNVKKRKYEVDIVGLQQCLKEHKCFSNKYISEKLNIPLTTVEHWFRRDSCFSIPDPEHWIKLKDLLNIETTEFDDSITEFVSVLGKYEKANRIYFCDGIAPTLTLACGNEVILIC